MSPELHRLLVNLQIRREPGWKPEEIAAAAAALRVRVVALAEGLPFPYSLFRAKPSHYARNIGAVHIVCAEDVAIGKLLRRRGDALCKPRWRFAGGLGELCPTEEGATCYGCLEVAEAHSIVEWQAS